MNEVHENLLNTLERKKGEFKEPFTRLLVHDFLTAQKVLRPDSWVFERIQRPVLRIQEEGVNDLNEKTLKEVLTTLVPFLAEKVEQSPISPYVDKKELMDFAARRFQHSLMSELYTGILSKHDVLKNKHMIPEAFRRIIETPFVFTSESRNVYHISEMMAKRLKEILQSAHTHALDKEGITTNLRDFFSFSIALDRYVTKLARKMDEEKPGENIEYYIPPFPPTSKMRKGKEILKSVSFSKGSAVEQALRAKELLKN
jgi:hypothetical protein